MAEELKTTQVEILLKPDWHHFLSCIMGDIKGEIGCITEFGTVHLLGKNNPDIPESATRSKINGPTTSITACKSLGFF